MNSTKKRLYIIDFIVIISCCISSIIIFASNTNANYNIMCLLPIIYIIVYGTYFSKQFKRQITPFKLVFGILLYIRYVFMPIGNAILGYTCMSKYIPSHDSYTIAQIILILELVILNIFLYITSKLKYFNTNKKNINTEQIEGNSNFVILLFICIVFVMVLINSNIWNAIYIIAPNSGSLKYDSLNDIEQTIILLFDIAKQCLFLMVLNKCKDKYQDNKQMRWFVLAMLFAIMNILVYVETNRANFVITIFATIYLLINIFYKYRKTILLGAIAVAIIIIPMISNYRQSVLITKDSKYLEIMEMANAYLAGIDNVAISIETSKQFEEYQNIGNFVYDMTRGVIGVNQLLKNINGKLSSNLFNYNFYGHWYNTSQIIPICGQGYFYFGITGFYIIELFFILIALIFEKSFLQNSNTYKRYFILIILMRLAMMQGLNGTILANRISFEIFIPFVLIFINKKITLRKEKK